MRGGARYDVRRPWQTERGIMEGTMKRLIFKGVGEVELQEAPIPSYGDDGVLIKVAYAGICGSDVHGFTKGGRYGGIGEGMEFGHEFVGTIVEVGKNVKDLHEGDRVWIDPTFSKPDPRFCCMAGGFGEYCGTLKAIKDETVFIIPDDVPLRTASLIEPFGVGVHTKNRGHVQATDNVLMWGAGPIGMMGFLAMKHQGVKNIFIAERMPERIEFAQKHGADVFDNTERSAIEYAAEKFGIVNISSYERANVDKYLDYVGLGSLINEYMTAGRPNSTFVTLGLDATPLTIAPNEFMSKQFTITGARAYEPADIREVIEVMQDPAIDVASLITGEFALEDAAAAFERACDKNSGMKTIFKIGGQE